MTDASAEKVSPTQRSLANLKELRRAFPTQAYMLIFIREDEIDEILAEPPIEKVPAPLKAKFDQENGMLARIENDWNLYCNSYTVFVLSPEIIVDLISVI